MHKSRPLPGWDIQRKLERERVEQFQTYLPLANNFINETTSDVSSGFYILDPWVYVVDWYWSGEHLYGIGVSERDGQCARLKLDVKPGLFVACADPIALHVYCQLNGFDVIYTGCNFSANIFTVYDVLLDESVVARPANLYKIFTKTFEKALSLFYELRKNPHARKFAAVGHYYDIATQIALERFCLTRFCTRTTYAWFNSKLNINFVLTRPHIPLITYDIETVSTDLNRVPTGEEVNDNIFSISIHHVDHDILYTLAYLPIPYENGKIACGGDLELNDLRDEMKMCIDLSDANDDAWHDGCADDNGDAFSIADVNDVDTVNAAAVVVVVGASEHHSPAMSSSSSSSSSISPLDAIQSNSNNTKSAISTPLKHWQSKCPTINDVHAKLNETMARHIGDNDAIENVREIYTNEREMLVRAYELLTDRKLHYLMGFNSRKYDNKVLLMRLQFFGLTDLTSQFVWNFGYQLCITEIHLDFYQMAICFVDTNKFTLQNIANKVLNDSKTGVDSVRLRITFFKMKYEKRLLTDDECRKWDAPTLQQALDYNNQDTLLLCKLLHKRQFLDTLIDQANKCMATTNEYLNNFDRNKFRIFKKLFCSALSFGRFMACNLQADSKIQVNVPFKIGIGETRNQSNCIGGTAADADVDAAAAAAANVWQSNDIDYCTLEIGAVGHLQNPYALNAKKKKAASFPGGVNYCRQECTIDDMQIFDLHVAYLKAITAANLSDETVTISRCDVLLDILPAVRSPQHFTCFEYHTHSSATSAESKILLFQFIEEGVHCGGQFELTHEELLKRGKSLVIVIVQASLYEGIASKVINHLSDVREQHKCDANKYENIISRMRELESKYQQLDENGKISQIHDFADSDDDDDNDDDNDDDENDDGNDSKTGDHNDHRRNNNRNDTPADIVQPKSKTPTIRFQHDLLTVYDNIDKFHERAVDISQWRTQFKELIEKLEMIRQNHADSYRLMKVECSSYYGCIGLTNRLYAASVTCIIRTQLIAICKWLFENWNAMVYYCDTDSIFFHVPGSSAKPASLANSINRNFKWINMKHKSTTQVTCVQKKCSYYVDKDGTIKYGQHKNGSSILRDFLKFMYNKTDISNYIDIFAALTEFYALIYGSPHSLSIFKCVITPQQSYAKQNPISEYLDYIKLNYPAMASSRRHDVFYWRDPCNINKSVYRPFVELERDGGSLRELNLHRLLDSLSFKTMFNFLRKHIRKNAKPLHMTISAAKVKVLHLHVAEAQYKRFFARNANSTNCSASESKLHKSALNLNSAESANTWELSKHQINNLLNDALPIQQLPSASVCESANVCFEYSEIYNDPSVFVSTTEKVAEADSDDIDCGEGEGEGEGDSDGDGDSDDSVCKKNNWPSDIEVD